MPAQTSPSNTDSVPLIDPEELEDIGSNPSANPTMGDVIAERLSRRDLIGGTLATTALTMTIAQLADEAAAQSAKAAPASLAQPQSQSFPFTELAAGADDRLHVAEGHDAQVLIRWGDPVLPAAPAFAPTDPSPAAQALQFGFNNDFIGYLPLDRSSRHGLLVVNHEYVSRNLMFPRSTPGGVAPGIVSRQTAQIEMMAHGGSVLEIRRERSGTWNVVAGSRYNRRITAETPMLVSGPAAGHPLMRTAEDPKGRLVRGMLSNCAGGITPWGTWLTCEENINVYFMGKPGEGTSAASLKRYGIPVGWYGWGAHYDRFDIAKEPNEANRFGWIVEIDPFDPKSVPVKRTAMGRFKHEGAGNVVNRDGRFVVYSGDDERFEYVYKFVTRDRVDRRNRKANSDILDHGTLYVARFDAGGKGEWLPLQHGQRGLDAARGFTDQAEVLIHARLAADHLGATRMDRPEDIEVNPRTGKVYVMLTNNTRRTAAQVDAANPRADNRYGHIIEIMPDGADHAATTFKWEILLRCGDPAIAAVGATYNPATSPNGWFSSPDNAYVDAAGRLWIATDGNSAKATGRTDGVWALETEGPLRGTSKLFLRVPYGAELCGPMMTPDMTTMFVAVQHPGEGEGPDGPSSFDKPSTRWPDFDPAMPPRPSVVAITRKNGGRIGG